MPQENLPKGSGLFCFIDQNRACNADCMAYLIHKPEGLDYEAQWAECMLLVNAHRLGKHTVALTAIVDGAVKKWKTQAADQQRAPAPPPIVVGSSTVKI
jgi:hypothetical protein